MAIKAKECFKIIDENSDKEIIIERGDIIKIKFNSGYGSFGIQEITGKIISIDGYEIDIDYSEKYQSKQKSIDISDIISLTKVEE